MTPATRGQRRVVHYSGDVQGVGFRFTARSIAAGFDVTGYVRNLPDGRVELVAEGEPAELEAFVRAVRTQMKEYIRDETSETMPAAEEFHSFEVRY